MTSSFLFKHMRLIFGGFAAVAISMTSVETKAQLFLGLDVGYAISGDATNIEGTENNNYPGEPTPATTFPGTTITDSKRADSPAISLLTGYWFESLPMLGIEASITYSENNFEEQVVLNTAPGQGSVEQLQLGIDANSWRLALAGLVRWTGFDGITPYAGLGPTLYLSQLSGSGRSAIDPANPTGGVVGPDIDETATGYGVLFKVGGYVPVADNWAIDLNYVYDYGQLEIDQIRSLRDIETNIDQHTLSAGVRYLF